MRTIDDRGFEDLKFEHSFPNVVDVSANVYYDYVDHSIGYPFATVAQNLCSIRRIKPANGGAVNYN